MLVTHYLYSEFTFAMNKYNNINLWYHKLLIQPNIADRLFRNEKEHKILEVLFLSTSNIGHFVM